jgi:TfoX/Sxy family transcriptional regulator of competence genes
MPCSGARSETVRYGVKDLPRWVSGAWISSLTSGEAEVGSRHRIFRVRGARHAGSVPRMAYDEAFAARIREALAGEDDVTEKAMFGGLAFLLAGNMAVGIANTGELMVRVGPDAAGDALAEPHTRVFDMGARPMRGWILVAGEGTGTADELARWVRLGVRFARSLPPKR